MNNITKFYKEIKENFPKINQKAFWNEYDWNEEGYENSFIMTEIAREICRWNIKTEYWELDNLFKIIEIGLTEYDEKTCSFLATDFLVTLMEKKIKLLEMKLKN